MLNKASVRTSSRLVRPFRMCESPHFKTTDSVRKVGTVPCGKATTCVFKLRKLGIEALDARFKNNSVIPSRKASPQKGKDKRRNDGFKQSRHPLWHRLGFDILFLALFNHADISLL